MMSYENPFIGNEHDKFKFHEVGYSPYESSDLFNPFPSTPLSVFSEQSASPERDYTTPVTDLYNTSPLSSDRQTLDHMSLRSKPIFSGYARPPEYAYQEVSGYSDFPGYLEMHNIRPDVSQFSTSNDLTFEFAVTPTTSQTFISTCKVCGDTASGNHFGVLSCEACKSFFRRSVRAKNSYACRANRNCAIEKLTRNRCQYCRLQKCILMGMKKEVVQDERVPLMSKSCQASLQPQYQYSYDCHSRPHSLSSTENTDHRPARKKGGSLPNLEIELEEVTRLQDSDSSSLYSSVIPSNDASHCTPNAAHSREITASVLVNADLQTDTPPVKVSTLTGNVLLKDIFEGARQSLLNIIEWVKQIPAFTALNLQDQMKLLKSSWFELVLMRLATNLRQESGSVLLGSEIKCFKDQIEDPDIRRIMEQVSNNISYWFDTMDVDHVEMACLKGIVLFNPDAKGLDPNTRKTVEILQEQSLKALQTRCRTVYPLAPLRFSKLLLRLAPLKVFAFEAKQHMTVQRTLGSSNVDNILCELLD